MSDTPEEAGAKTPGKRDSSQKATKDRGSKREKVKRSPEFYASFAKSKRLVSRRKVKADSDEPVRPNTEMLYWIDRLAGIGASGETDISSHVNRYLMEDIDKRADPPANDK